MNCRFFFRRPGFRRILLLLPGFFVCVLLLPEARAANTEAVPQAAPKILLISSFHLSHKWTMEVNNAITQELDQMPDAPIVDYLELNSVRNRTSDYIGKFEPYRRMIRERKFDLVVAILDDAINLLLENLDTIPADQPIVFCGYQELTPEFAAQHPNITGLAVNFQVMKTVEMGLALMPDTQEVAIVTDDLPSGLLTHRRMQSEAAGFKRCRIRLINGAEYSTQQMLDAVRSMPEKSFVVFCPWRNYARDGYASLLNVGEEIDRTGRPYLVITDVLFGKGALGGCMSLGDANGRGMARIIREVLKNKRADEIPFAYDDGEFAADMTVLEKFGLSGNRLPPGTITINRRIPLWESHRAAVIATAAAIFLLIALGMAMVFFHLRFRRLNSRMREEQDSMIAELDNHVANERIFNHCLQRITIGQDSRKAVQEMLETIGIHAGADRIYIFQYRDGRYADNIFEWSAPGIPPQMDNLQNVDMSQFPLILEFFLSGRPLEVADTDHPVPGMENAADFLHSQEIRSALLCGIWEQEKLWGFIGMDFVRSLHSFTESDRRMLNNAVNLFLLARERRRQIDAISESVFRQKQIFDSITIPIVMFDLDYNITMVNPASCSTTGKTPEELLGHKCHRVLCGHDTPPDWCPMHQVFIDRQAHQISYEGHGGRHYLVTLQPIFDRENKLTGILENALDITDLVNQKREQEVTNVFLKRAGEIAGITYFKGDADGNIQLLGGSEANTGSLTGNGKFEEWLLPEELPAFRKVQKELTSGGKEVVELICRSAASGGIRTYKLFATAYSRTENIYLGILQDVTEAMELEEEKNSLIVRLNAYVENEKIINGCLTQLVQDEDFDRNIGRILKTLANQLDGDRAYCGSYSADGSGCRITHEWRNAGIQSLHEIRDPAFWEQLLKWQEPFRNNELLKIPDIPASAYAVQLREPGCHSLLCAPVMVNRELAGVIGLGFIRHRREITEFDENMIRSVAQLISLALQRDTRHRELEMAIGEREAVFRNIGMPIMLFDRTGKLTRVNPTTCSILRKSETEVLSQPCFHMFCGEKTRPGWCPVMQTIDTGKSSEIELEIRGREYVIKAEPAFDESGAIRYVIENAIDITEINESKRQLERAVLAEQAAGKAKSYFLATMSHEIRTPLNAVIGFSELLRKGSLSEGERREYLDSIHLAGNSLLRLINDVLDLSKLESEQLVLTPQPTDILALLREILAVFQYKVREKNLFLRLECPPELPCLKLDSIRLRQILLNLIGNAVKFTERGGITLGADFLPRGNRETGTFRISVRDTGIGITEEAQGRLFRPFVQSDAVRDTHVYGGTGLGLAISLRLAERMGGTISLESEPGKGSAFTVRLENVEPAQRTGTGGERRGVFALRSRRVLLVDDVPMNLKVLQAMLKTLNIGSVCAGSGAKALEILKGDKDFQFILTDLWMPEMNGVQLAEIISTMPERKSMRVVATTADTGSAASFDMSVFDATLHKPLSLQNLKKLFHEMEIENGDMS
ncbi:MAG: PAS domain-containing protein [Lentisphaeria bacterium]|nr:PAS domain-containing protein [Lentisphaeria bacterium]